MKRIRTVEYDPGWGWIARNPYTGEEIIEDFVWCSRSVARAVVAEARLGKPSSKRRARTDLGIEPTPTRARHRP
jgi:hypothetical protein